MTGDTCSASPAIDGVGPVTLVAAPQPVVRSLLVRGLLAGLLAGLVGLVVATLLGEPQIAQAIAFEQSHAAGEAEPETFSRTVQATAGLATGLLLFGLALGALFGLTYAYAQGRLGGLGVRATAALVALAGFVTVVLVPFAKYPANPPSVGDPATIGRRTGLYFALLALSVALAVLAAQLGRFLAPRLGAWDASIAAGVAFIAAIAVVLVFLPAVEEVPADFPASVLWRFRLASLAVQAAMWATLGLTFGALTERSWRGRRAHGLGPTTTPRR